MKRKFVSSVLIAALLTIPIQTAKSDDPPPENMGLAICVIACAAIAVGAVYIVAHKCQPKYYWLMDNDSPPKFWVATATKKQCQIEGWHRIGGPYTRPQDAPAVHPDATNRVELVSQPAMNIAVQQTQDGQSWTTVYQQNCDTEDFGYSPTNCGMFRLVVSP